MPEVPAYLRVSPVTVRCWVESGQIEVDVLPARTLRFREDADEAFVSQHPNMARGASLRGRSRAGREEGVRGGYSRGVREH